MQLTALLINGDFHVHRAGCADIKRDSRQSDSLVTAEEYGSERALIEEIWGDILGEDPDSTWEDYASATYFKPCTRGLPTE